MKRGLHIFRSGKHQASDGRVLEFTPAMLEASAKAYDPAKHRAPLCIGHPKHDAPAYGWVTSLEATGKGMFAGTDKVDPELAKEVATGKRGALSASFYEPNSPSNPVPGVYYLRHVGFLGAQPPAVKGLEPPSFAENEQGVVEFADFSTNTIATMFTRMREFFIEKFGVDDAEKATPAWMVDSLRADAQRELDKHLAAEAGMAPAFAETEPPAPQPAAPQPTQEISVDIEEQKKQLEQKQAELAERETKLKAAQDAIDAKAAEERRAGAASFAEELVKSGQLLPRQKNGLVELLVSLTPGTTFDFAEGEAAAKVTKPALDVLKDILKAMPKQVDFSERARAEGEPVVNFSDAQSIADAAARYQAEQEKLGNHVRASDAVAHVTKR